jgi:hypothetical protein
MKASRAFLFCAALFGILVFAGCEPGPKNYSVDFNAYACSGCNGRFYTPGTVHAQQCPSCESYAIEDAVAYVCPADNTRTMSVRSGEGGICKQCRRRVSASSFPTEAELTEWGAVKKTKAEVGAR